MIPARLEIVSMPSTMRRAEHPDLWGAGDGHPFEGSVIDLCANGARVSTETPLERCSRIMASVDLPGYGIVDAVGLVVWCERSGAEKTGAGNCCAGVSFEVIDSDVQEWIARIVAPLETSSPRGH